MFILELLDYKMEEKLTPVKFHPYSSTVIDRLIVISDDDGKTVGSALRRLEEQFIKMFNDAGIKCVSDNKIVFECKYKGQTMLFGFKDGRLAIGFGLFKGR